MSKVEVEERLKEYGHPSIKILADWIYAEMERLPIKQECRERYVLDFAWRIFGGKRKAGMKFKNALAEKIWSTIYMGE